MKKILPILALFSLSFNLFPTNIGQATSSKPTIYVSIVTHNEEPNGTTHPDFTSDYDTYVEYRDAAVNFAELLHEYGAKYDFQSDWNFLKAEQEYGTSFSNTGNENLLKWLVNDMDFSVDPHAHESTYSIADVAYLMKQLGITPSNIVGGFIASPSTDSRVEDFQVPIDGWKYDTTWEADALWGAATGMHADDSDLKISGIWRAKDNEHFTTDDEDSKPVIGGYTSDWDGLDDLLEKRDNGELESGRMYTVTIMNNQVDFTDQNNLDEFETNLKKYSDETSSGAIQWVTLPEALEIWESTYDSTPTIYSNEEGDLSPETASTSSNTSNSSSSSSENSTASSESSNPFNDITSTDDYYAAIQYVYEQNIVEGYSDGTYKPANAINRAEFTKILIEAVYPNQASRAETCFTDIDSTAWYAKYVCFAKVYNIVSGYGDGTYMPAQSINVAEALKITLLTYFGSIPNTSGEWYQKYWDYAQDHGYILSAWDSAAHELTRGEMAELIYLISQDL